MSVIPHTEVIIVGAGPTGLALAALLAKHSIPFRLFESRPQPYTTSRALGVQAGTLECLRSAFGSALSQRMKAIGWPIRYVEFHLEQQPALEVPLYSIPSDFNFVLILEQAKTEALLNAELERNGRSVERGVKVTDAKMVGEGVQVRIQTADGIESQVNGSFLVGCDGAHSFVRHEMNMPFEGGSYSGTFALADAHLDSPLAYTKSHVFVRKAGLVACFPFSDRSFRLIVMNHPLKHPEGSAPEDQGGASAMSESDFQQRLASVVGDEIRIQRTTWTSEFRVHHRIAQYFHRERIFLCGDAAHIHSPIGGQGMNTGIQDALNLGMKFVRIFKRDEPQKILNDYHPERYPVAHKILRSTDLAFRAALKDPNQLLGKVRDFMLPSLLKTKPITERILYAVSELEPARNEISRYLK